jgi:hypothetical protein
MYPEILRLAKRTARRARRWSRGWGRMRMAATLQKGAARVLAGLLLFLTLFQRNLWWGNTDTADPERLRGRHRLENDQNLLVRL